ncbi:MAG: CRTAC1 family protein [Armatimonadota bacterium]
MSAGEWSVSRRGRVPRLLIAGASLLAVAAAWKLFPSASARPESPSVPVRFTNVTAEAGIDFRHNSGARGKKYMPETVGAGCGWIDYNSDGWPDLFFVNGSDWPDSEKRKPSYPSLYRNNRDGTFSEVTEAAGLKTERYGMGVAVGDFDNDGLPDLYLTCIGPNVLYRNRGDGTFQDVTARSGVAGEAVEVGGLRWKWSSSPAWIDYNRDGRLDLFVGNYVSWTPQTDVWCGTRDGRKAYCPPNSFAGVPSLLYRNEGDGRFRNVSAETGIGDFVGKSFGVAVADYNADGWLDLAVANDTSPNFLFLNQEGKRFEERGLEAGIALSNMGHAKAGMGIDAADWGNNGRWGLLVGNFSEECLSLYENDGKGLFTDRTYPMGMGETSLTSLTFGAFFFDFDLDGWQDAFAANGHIDTFVNENNAQITYEQRPLLFRSEQGERFREVGETSGRALSERMVLRGTAFADYDRDGDLDIAAVWNNGPARLWRNDGGNRNRWIRLELRGKRANRDGIGAVVSVTAGGMTRQHLVKSGSSFLSQSELPLTVGLGSAERADRVEVRWANGDRDTWSGLEAGHHYYLEQGGQPERAR